METQNKFFNKQYIETRLREIKEIKRKDILFDIEESDRAFSRSLYVNFYCPSSDNKIFKGHTIRISDHLLDVDKCPHSQFIVDPTAIMTKKKKAQFIRTIENSIIKTKTKHFYKELKEIYKNNETV